MTQGLVILSKNTGYREINGNAWVLVFFLPPEGHFFFLALDPDTLADLLDVPYRLFIMRMGSWGLYPGTLGLMNQGLMGHVIETVKKPTSKKK